MRKPITKLEFVLGVIFAIIVFALLTACAPSDDKVTGEWEYSGDGFSFDGTVEGNTMDLYLTIDGLRLLYWTGEFPDSLDDDAVFISVGDTDAMDSSLYGSQDETKLFTYDDNQIGFTFTIFNDSQIVKLERA